MTPSEAQKVLEQIKAKSASQVRLRVVGSVDNPDAEGPGARLQQARRNMGLSVVQVSQALKLRPDQIAAIEAMQFSRLPGLGYALGYVRAYAELLDIGDIKGVVDDFKDSWAPQQKRNEASRQTFNSKLALPIGFIIGFGLLAWLIIAAIVQTSLPRNEDAIAIPDEAIKEWASKDVVAKGRSLVEIDPLIVVHAYREANVTLRGEDGALVLSRYLKAGEDVSTDGLGRFILSTNDAGAIEVRGLGINIPVGEDYAIIENWRVPDIKAMAKAKADEAAAQAAASAAKDANKIADLKEKNTAPTPKIR